MKNMNIDKAPRIAMTGVAALVSTMTLAACGISNRTQTADPWLTSPTPGKPVYPGNGTQEIPLHSSLRERFGTEMVIDYCVNGQYLQYDPEIQRLFKAHETGPILNPMAIPGPQAEAACADGRLTDHDPVPLSLDLGDLPQ